MQLSHLRPGRALPGQRLKGGTLTGHVRCHEVSSRLLGDTRNVLVWLPPGYSPRCAGRYPVVYLQDGQNVFDRRTACFGVEWGADEQAELLMRRRVVRPALLVAVYNGPRRHEEYTPFPDRRHGGGGAALYARFLLEELMPRIDAWYRTSPHGGDTAVAGSSLGGLLALYLGWMHPERFGLVGALSPSVWWADRELLRMLRRSSRIRRPQRIWLDMGTAESGQDQNGNGVPDVLEDVRDLRRVLEERGYRVGRDLFYREFPGAGHDEGAWGRRVGLMLRQLLPAAPQRSCPLGVRAG